MRTRYSNVNSCCKKGKTSRNSRHFGNFLTHRTRAENQSTSGHKSNAPGMQIRAGIPGKIHEIPPLLLWSTSSDLAQTVAIFKLVPKQKNRTLKTDKDHSYELIHDALQTNVQESLTESNIISSAWTPNTKSGLVQVDHSSHVKEARGLMEVLSVVHNRNSNHVVCMEDSWTNKSPSLKNVLNGVCCLWRRF